MNLGAIKSLCQGGRRATIYNNGQEQWISCGTGAYLVEGVRIVGAQALMELWNLTDKARDKADITLEEVSDSRFTVQVCEDEEELRELGGVVWGDGVYYIALQSENGVLWVDARYFRPLREDYRQYYARWSYGRPLIAVYENMADGCKALVYPTDDKTANRLQAMATEMKGPPYLWNDGEA